MSGLLDESLLKESLLNELKCIKKAISQDNYLLMNDHYSPLLIDGQNFHRIVDVGSSEKLLDNNSFTDSVNDIVTFVDGGQAILFENTNFCLAFIRTAAVSYKNNVRVSRDMSEFYLLVKEDNGKLKIKTCPSTDFDNLIFDSNDKKIQLDIDTSVCSKIVSMIRRFAELSHAKKINESSRDEFNNIILDGTLESRYPNEIEYLKKFKNISALSKTCSLNTNQGVGVVDCLRAFGNSSINYKRWYYYPIVKNNNPDHLAEIFFVKLNEKSDYIFRFEHKGKNAEAVIRILSNNSLDPLFLGYPYGLIDVDNFARISDQEKKILQTRISVKLGPQWNEFSKNLKSMNAHEILDNIKF